MRGLRGAEVTLSFFNTELCREHFLSGGLGGSALSSSLSFPVFTVAMKIMTFADPIPHSHHPSFKMIAFGDVDLDWFLP